MANRDPYGVWTERTEVLDAPPSPPIAPSPRRGRRPPQPPSERFLTGQHAIPLAIAAGVVGLSLPSGGYGVAARAVTAIAAWWLILLFAILAPRGAIRVPVLAKVTAGALGGLTVMSGLSALWAANPEGAFLEFDRAALYLALYTATIILFRRGQLRAAADGLALGIVAVAILALASRCLPGILNENHLATLLPSVATRLSYPLDYWNGLGIFLAMAAPLLLSRSVGALTAWGRGLALAPLPALAATIYLTSSRGAVVVAVVGIAACFAALPRRLAALAATVLAAAASALAIVVLKARPELVDGPLRSAAAHTQGPAAFGLIALICVAVAVVHGLTSRDRLRATRLPRGMTVAVTIVAAAIVAAAIVLSHPGRRFDTFKQPPSALVHPSPNFVSSHLLSGGGSGRWEFWSAAVQEFRAHPIAGDGAGSYQAWWLRHGSISYFIRNAHSQYVETLGELGIIGGLLLVGALACGLVGGAVRRRVLAPDQRWTVAGILGAFAAFVVGVGIDWIWQLTVVSGVGIILLALLTGPATLPTDPVAAQRGRIATVLRPAARVLTVLVALFVVGAEALPWLVQGEIRSSQTAAKHGQLRLAADRAATARALQPWASSPYLQLALVEEQGGAYSLAEHTIVESLHRSRNDWQQWLIAARIEQEAGSPREALRSLARARKLNPRSPVFAGLKERPAR